MYFFYKNLFHSYRLYEDTVYNAKHDDTVYKNTVRITILKYGL